MPTFIGFSTQYAKQNAQQQRLNGIGYGTGSVRAPIIPTNGFTLTDAYLVTQDLINALQISQGSKPGRPEYGTIMWELVFEPWTLTTQNQIDAEVQRIVAQDPRLILNSSTISAQENGVNIALQVTFRPFNSTQTITLFFDKNTNTVLNLS